MESKLRIAILGTRGIPARYGGFETFAERLSTDLASRGHKVTVFCRRRFFEEISSPSDFEGVRLKFAPTVMHKYLETPLHAFFSFMMVSRKDYDLILLCNAANAPFAWLASLRGLPVVINVDGIERRRSKWNWVGKSWYRLGEICAMLFGRTVIADAESIARYYRTTYGADPIVIAYGAQAHKKEAGETLKRYNLQSKSYILYVSRLEPENNALGVIKAYLKSGVGLPLVVVGDAPYAAHYKELLQQAAAQGGKSVVFTGFQFGESYQELQSNCYLYIQATEVGGTHPALIEAMAYGNAVIANGTPENLEVLGASGVYFWRNDFDNLALRIKQLVHEPLLAKQLGEGNSVRAIERFSWPRITSQYEKLARNLCC